MKPESLSLISRTLVGVRHFLGETCPLSAEGALEAHFIQNP